MKLCEIPQNSCYVHIGFQEIQIKGLEVSVALLGCCPIFYEVNRVFLHCFVCCKINKTNNFISFFQDNKGDVEVRFFKRLL